MESRAAHAALAKSVNVKGERVNWVDIFQVLGSLATALALIYVAKSTAHAKKAAEAAEQQLSVERARDDVRRQERARAQAHQISIWPAILHRGGVDRWGVAVANSSGDPIYDLDIQRPLSHSRNNKVPIPRLDLRMTILPPGIYFCEPETIPVPAGPEQLEPIFKNSDYCAELTFRDSSSALWHRARDGQLTAVRATPVQSES